MFQIGTIKDRTGEIGYNTQGNGMKILKYNSARDVIIQFDSGYVVSRKYEVFLSGNIKDMYHRSVYGVGYIGEGKYDTLDKTNSSRRHTRAYVTWTSMLQRCYHEKHLNDNPSYIGCTVCTQWQCFQNFAEWFYDNYYEVEGHKMHLDKDILYDGNKIYSPETCIFAPAVINIAFKNRQQRKKIRMLAEEYKELIPLKLYDHMLYYD